MIGNPLPYFGAFRQTLWSLPDATSSPSLDYSGRHTVSERNREMRLVTQGSAVVTKQQQVTVQLTPVAWIAGQELDFEDWARAGRRMGMTGRSAGWWLGDWLRYGNARYGERYARAARITGYDTQTLMNMVYVASRIDASRRRENLSWSHHAEVAPLEPDRQEHWLRMADVDHLSVRDLREAVRTGRAAERAPAEDEQAGPAPGTVLRCPACGHALS
jgi:hypothetical protein